MLVSCWKPATRMFKRGVLSEWLKTGRRPTGHCGVSRIEKRSQSIHGHTDSQRGSKVEHERRPCRPRNAGKNQNALAPVVFGEHRITMPNGAFEHHCEARAADATPTVRRNVHTLGAQRIKQAGVTRSVDAPALARELNRERRLFKPMT